MKFLLKLFLILLLALPTWASAKAYGWKDSEGNQHYSDKPHANARLLDIKPGKEFFKIEYVYDGDTIQLEDGRKIRFSGLNTPEVEHHGSKADAGGDEAKAWLMEKLKNTRVRIETDTVKTDDYGRTLAHVFTEKGEHLNLQLLTNGLAELNIFPPNLLYIDEMVKAQDQAEAAKLGIWQRPEYAPIPVDQLTAGVHAGYTRVTGTVTKISTTKNSIYLDFSSHFNARIDRDWASLFPDTKTYQGKTLEVRGWLKNGKDDKTMLIRHPSAIKFR